MFRRFWWIFVVMLPVGAVGGLLVMAVVTYVMPRQYESEAVIEVRHTQPPSTDESAVHTTPQYSSGIEFDRIKSRESLDEVVLKLELTNKWGVNQEAAIRILKEIVSVENIRGTNLIAIRVRHTDRESVRDIAAQLARTDRDYRVEIIHRERDRDLYELNKAVRDQEDKVEERRKVLATIQAARGPEKSHEIENDGANSNEESPEPEKNDEAIKRKVLGDQQDYDDAKRDLETDQALLQAMKLEQIKASIANKTQNELFVVHEESQIPQAPVSPNVALNLILGAVGGGLLSPLLALPLILLLNRLNPVRVDSPPVLP
jgi:uncharacterized protein involved in exopolysaccharide biosynthesis